MHLEQTYYPQKNKNLINIKYKITLEFFEYLNRIAKMIDPTLIRIQKILVTILNETDENTRYDDVSEYFLELDDLIDQFENYLGSYYDDICDELYDVDYYINDVRDLILELLYRVNDLIVNYTYWV